MGILNMRKKLDWECQESGWWTTWILKGTEKIYMAVCRERDRKWHSYVNDDTVANSPSFPTMKLAMEDAENRAK
jgi:hypothetical protein